MEEHLGSEEAFIADITGDHPAVKCFVHELFEARRLFDFAVFQDLFLVKLLVLFEQIFRHIAMVLFYLLCDLYNIASR